MSDSIALADHGKLFAVSQRQGWTVLVNERVRFRTIRGYRVVSVDSVIVRHCAIDDRMAGAYAMVTLVETGYAERNDVVRAFGYTSRSLRRYQQRFEEGSLQALGRSRGRPPGTGAVDRKHSNRDKRIMGLKNEGVSNREIARQLAIDEKAIRKRLRKLGWQLPGEQLVLFEEQGESESPTSTDGIAPNGVLCLFEYPLYDPVTEASPAK